MLTVFEVMRADAEHLQMTIDGQVELKREVDCTMNANEPDQSPFIEVINGPCPVVVRRSDWRINSTSIANQVGNRHLAAKLRWTLNRGSYDVFKKGGNKHRGTYVDFDLGIKWCREELGLNDLANQLLHLKPTENERAVDVQQDTIASPVLKDHVGEVSSP